MKIIALATFAAMTACLFGGAAFAQTAAPPAKAVPAQRSAQSLECSKQADARGLHLTARRKFLATCNKSAAK